MIPPGSRSRVASSPQPNRRAIAPRPRSGIATGPPTEPATILAQRAAALAPVPVQVETVAALDVLEFQIAGETYGIAISYIGEIYPLRELTPLPCTPPFVRGILSDIEKATTASVMATDEGNKAVAAGVAQSASAGESIRSLAESIEDATQAATQIAVSSQQQRIGMDQIALAMENIKQASLQNVVGTKQTAASAHNLHDLGQKLTQLVNRYQV
jgi:methyl-accepting chemotaxis protein